MKPRALDLFCGAGGATHGLQLAGFHVTGVDLSPQPRYCGDEFHQTDAIVFPAADFDFIWASPPCQAHSALRHLHPQKAYECFIERTRAKLIAWGGPYVIENVPGAPLLNPTMYCGSMFGLRVRRHRNFESNFPLRKRLCQHKWQGTPVDVSGTGGCRISRRRDDHGGNCNKPKNLAHAREVMQMPWASRYEISQAIPPAYSKYIGEQMMPHVLARKVCAA